MVTLFSIFGEGAIWIFIALALLAAMWFFLPLAIFGTKTRLDTLIALQKKTNRLLEETLIRESQGGN